MDKLSCPFFKSSSADFVELIDSFTSSKASLVCFNWPLSLISYSYLANSAIPVPSAAIAAIIQPIGRRINAAPNFVVATVAPSVLVANPKVSAAAALVAFFPNNNFAYSAVFVPIDSSVTFRFPCLAIVCSVIALVSSSVNLVFNNCFAASSSLRKIAAFSTETPESLALLKAIIWDVLAWYWVAKSWIFLLSTSSNWLAKEVPTSLKSISLAIVPLAKSL